MSENSKLVPTLIAILVLNLVLLAYVLFAQFVFGTPWTEQTVILFVSVIVSLGMLSNVFPVIDRVLNAGLRHYFRFTFLFFLLVMPAIGYIKMSQWVADSAPDWLKMAFFIVSGIIWLCLVALLGPSTAQEKVFARLKPLGWFIPLVFLVNFILVSAVFFGFLALYIYGADPAAGVHPDSYVLLFFYHFLDSIPALKIPETLRWSEPIPGDRPVSLGWMLLLFKFAVLVPGIGAFRSYWKSKNT